MCEFLKSQLGYVYFIYGLEFVILGVICAALWKKRTNQILRVLLSLFGLMKNAEQRLDRSNECFILANIPDLAWFKDKNGRFIDANEPFAKACGISVENLIGLTDLDVWPKELAEKYIADDQEIIASKHRIRIEEQFALQKSKISWVETIKTPIFNSKGEVIGVTGIARDISERRMAEKLLQESEARYRTLVDQAADGIFIIDRNGYFLDVNLSGCKMTGYIREQILMMNMANLTAFQDLDRLPLIMEKLLRGKGSVDEWRLRRSDGTELPAELSTNLLSDGRLQVMVRDITERKHVEEELHKAHAQTELLLASICSILICTDINGVVQTWNSAAERSFGLSSQEAIGQTLDQCAISWNKEQIKEVIASCQVSDLPIRIDDVRFTRSDGKEGFLGITINRVTDEKGNPSGMLFLCADITNRKLLESQLAQAQKLESIGQLAAGIAHEINTPTQYVGDNTRFLQDAFNDLQKVMGECNKLIEAKKNGNVTHELIDNLEAVSLKADTEYLREEIPKAIEQSLEGISRVTKIVRAMKEFSHPGSEEKTPTDINKAIENTITVARNEWKYVADLELQLDPSLNLVPCLPGEFNQIILNIVINAAHAIADVVGDGSNGKGLITITTKADDDSAEIRISDTGSGIPESARPKIFDPFFISHSVIVEKHGGTISFDTDTGKGTTFIIRLPYQAKSQLDSRRAA
jgi:PAS domain S-box-containing protein